MLGKVRELLVLLRGYGGCMMRYVFFFFVIFRDDYWEELIYLVSLKKIYLMYIIFSCIVDMKFLNVVNVCVKKKNFNLSGINCVVELIFCVIC